MIKGFFLALAITFVLSAFISASSLDISFDNNLDLHQDQIDTSVGVARYYGFLSAQVQHVTAADLSLVTDLGYTNGFADPTRKRFDLRTCYLDMGPLAGFTARLGRQQENDLINDALFIDGAQLGYMIANRVSISAYAGLTLPSLYTASFISSESNAYTAVARADAEIVKGIRLGIQGGRVLKSDGSQEVPVAGYADARIGSMIKIGGTAVYELNAAILREYSADLSVSPVTPLSVRISLLGEDQSIDSTNAYEELILGKHTDIGVRGWFKCHCGKYVSARYTYRILDEGADNLAEVTGSAFGITLGIGYGSGFNGTSYKPWIGYRYSIVDGLDADASVSWYNFILANREEWQQALHGRAAVAWNVFSSGLTIGPEVQYISNTVYDNDLRVLVNARYNLTRLF